MRQGGHLPRACARRRSQLCRRAVQSRPAAPAQRTACGGGDLLAALSRARQGLGLGVARQAGTEILRNDSGAFVADRLTAERSWRCALVSRFRRSYHLAARAFTNVGTKGTLANL